MAQNTTDNNRRLKFEEKPQYLPEVKGWQVITAEDEELGTARGFVEDKDQKEPRYLEMQDKQSQNRSIPVGFVSVDKEAKKLVLENLDTYTLGTLPSHAEGKLPSYEEELKLRARLEGPAKVYSKLGKDKKMPKGPAPDRTGVAINKEITEPEDAYKRDKDLNEGHVSNSLQGEYTPNLQADEEGIKKRAANPEGKHDIPSASGHPGSTSKGSVAAERTGGQVPDESELPTTDRPGATLGNAEVENRYREPQNQSLPQGQGNPDLPANAPDDFYKHPMFDSRSFR